MGGGNAVDTKVCSVRHGEQQTTSIIQLNIIPLYLLLLLPIHFVVSTRLLDCEVHAGTSTCR